MNDEQLQRHHAWQMVLAAVIAALLLFALGYSIHLLVAHWDDPCFANSECIEVER
jgi:hypothetical protein